MAARTLLVVCLLVLAGCTTPMDPSAPATKRSAATATTTERGTQTATPPTAAAGTNPWGSDPVVVAVRNEGNRNRTFAPLVREAAAFWEAEDERYLGFPVEYEVRPDASNPDLVVTFTDRLDDCGGVTDAVGCAPRITDSRAIDRPETVRVKTGLSNESTVLVTKHELGHTLGLGHDDAPQAVMQARSVIYTEPQPDATEREFPWADADFTVSVDRANASDPEGVDRQVGHALTYYEEGAPGMPDNVTFRRVDADAEVRILFGPTDECSAGSGSCVSTYGTDPDGDGAIEEYTRVDIRLVDLDTDAVGWHVGYWLAEVFGAEADAEKPPPFRDASYRERRSAWWE